MRMIPPEVKRRLMWSGIVASAVGAVLVAAYTIVLPAGPGVRVTRDEDLMVSGVALVLYLAMSLPVGHWWCGRSICRAEALAADDDGMALLRLPGTIARMTFVLWCGAAVVFSTIQYALDRSGYLSVRVFDAIMLGGCITAAVEYLGAERLLRSSFATVLQGRAPRRRVGPGLRRRFRLSWVLGSGIPLMAVVVSPFNTPPAQRADLVPAYVVLGCAGLLAGWLLSERSARAVTEPMHELRHALRRVQDGDLDVTLQVDDSGDIGVVQAGFNAALEGLRERRRIEQLFGMQVGEEVARLAIQRGVDREVERAECSILFVDVVSSSAVVNSSPPEEVAVLFARLFDVVVRAVHAEGGWVNKFQGDGAMCVFGPPAQYDDHAARALRCARTLRRELLALAAQLPGFDAAVGVSSGTVVAGNIGGADRYEYTVLGRPVHEAARLTEAAKLRLGRVLASEETLERAGNETSFWTVAAELTLRGFEHPLRAFEPAPATWSVGQAGSSSSTAERRP
jgi:adenylate cyclase